MEQGASMKLGLVVFMVLTVVAVVRGVQHGTHQIGRVSANGYRCGDVTFPTAFTGIGSVKVFTSVGFGTSSARVHDVVFTWVESVTTNSFRVCLVESGTRSNGNVTINWIAYQGTESGVADGSVRFRDWTSGTQCNNVPLPTNYSSKPHVFVTAKHNVLDRKQDAATIWVEDIRRDGFTVCMREGCTFDGRHKDIDVTWMAMPEVPQTWNSHDFITLDFLNTQTPTEADNYAFCQTKNFKEPYYSAPTIVLTASHEYDSSNVNSVPPEQNSIVAWVEETSRTNFKTCVKDLVGLKDKHHPIRVDYLVFGDLDPCINKTCEYFGVCQAMSPSLAQCVCFTDCPSYQDLVCASNGQTFDNLCLMQKEICRTSGNYSYYHPGGCQGFPLDKGRHHLSHISSFAESHCEVVSLKPYTFYPDKPMHAQVTVNYANTSLPVKVHDATVTWTEKVSTDNFTVCITKTGRNDKQTNDIASVDWIAYQGAPNGGVTGKERFTQWWTGTKCKTISLPSGKFTGFPTVLVTLDHQIDGLEHNAASVWVEDISSSSFQVCIRELQNFDGVHEHIDVNWMAFEILHRPLFSEHRRVYFANNYTPPKSDNYAFCKSVYMTRNYTSPPLVMITATHKTGGSGGGSNNPKCNGISAWIEDITSNEFRACIKELYSDRYDPVTLQYVVVSDICGEGWTYFNGFCYRTSSTCLSWQAAQSKCLHVNSNLTSITSQEENTYVQHRHGGDTGWIGLQDIDSEGNFTWIDGTAVSFTYWARNQPNSYPGDQDCVHTLGLRHKYHWNDVTCSTCQGYTCKRDFDECSSTVAHTCHADGNCINSYGSYSCRCHLGGQQCIHVQVSVASGCTYTSIDESSGTFTSPSYPGNYANKQSCYWLLTSISKVSLTFQSFTTERNCDFVKVYDGNSSSATLLGSFSGTSLPPSISSSSNKMYVTFTSDHSNVNSGFCARYAVFGPECSSYTSITDASRNVNYEKSRRECDNGITLQWYRLEGSAGVRMPTSCVPTHQCDTNAPGWLRDPHPTIDEGIVSRRVCFHWDNNCCHWSEMIRVRNCGSFYVYEFKPPSNCSLRYCGTT